MTSIDRFRAARVAAVLFLAMTVLLAPRFAQPVQAKTQILTETTVKKFIASYPAVRSVAEQHAAETGANLAGAQDHFSALIEIVSDKAAVKKIETAVEAHGFGSAKDWVAVAKSVGHAYVHVKAGGAQGKAERRLEKAIAKIEKNGLLSDSQKAKLISALREGAGSVLESPPPENLAAVSGMMAELDALMQ